MPASRPSDEDHLTTTLEKKPQPSVQAQPGLDEFEQEGDGRPAFLLTYAEIKLLGIAGVSFLHLKFSLHLLCNKVGFFLDGTIN
jgi:PHS family inorganic phosphate transporter-like MFS transporter